MEIPLSHSRGLKTLWLLVKRKEDGLALLKRARDEFKVEGYDQTWPEIWENMEDFESKMADLRAATEALEEAAESGDREQIAEAFAAAGGACKACHDEYKSKDYLY